MPKLLYNSYIICTSPRSGSTLLCKLLEKTGKSGNPNSHFHNPSLSSWLETYQLHTANFPSKQQALSAVFDAAIKKGTGDTGVFGLRLQRGSLDFFMQQTCVLYSGMQSDSERIEAAFGHTLLIYLTRSNKLDQAISLVKATQTGLWHKASDGSELERLSEPQDPYYDADAISHHLKELTELDAAWRAWFQHEQLQPLEISYDELSRDPLEVLGRVLSELGLEKEMARGISSPTAKLADTTSRTWADRFSADQHRV